MNAILYQKRLVKSREYANTKSLAGWAKPFQNIVCVASDSNFRGGCLQWQSISEKRFQFHTQYPKMFVACACVICGAIWSMDMDDGANRV